MSDRYNNDRRELNAIERDRLERRRQLKRKAIITNTLVGAVAVAIIAGIIILIVVLAGRNKSDGSSSSSQTVTETIVAERPQNSSSSAVQATQTPSGSANGSAASSPVQDPAQTYDNDSDSDGSSSSSSQSSPQNTTDNTPGGTATVVGNSLQYTTYGSTSDGWDYTYYYDANYVNVTCDYDTTAKAYNFHITGVQEGTTSLTLYYYVADGNMQEVPLTVYVDSSLNVTQVG